MTGAFVKSPQEEDRNEMIIFYKNEFLFDKVIFLT
jgi:hypothetical protein